MQAHRHAEPPWRSPSRPGSSQSDPTAASVGVHGDGAQGMERLAMNLARHRTGRPVRRTDQGCAIVRH